MYNFGIFNLLATRVNHMCIMLPILIFYPLVLNVDIFNLLTTCVKY